MSITCTLVPEDELVCKSQPDGGYISPSNADGADQTVPICKGRTNRRSLEEPELLMSMITDIYKKRTNMAKSDIKNILKTDRYIPFKDALTMGLVTA